MTRWLMLGLAVCAACAGRAGLDGADDGTDVAADAASIANRRLLGWPNRCLVLVVTERLAMNVVPTTMQLRSHDDRQFIMREVGRPERSG